MYEVRNNHDDVVYKNEDAMLAKIHAKYLHENNTKLTYYVVKVEQIYSTQTLDEAIKS